MSQSTNQPQMQAAVWYAAKDLRVEHVVIFRRRLHQLTGRNARCAGDS